MEREVIAQTEDIEKIENGEFDGKDLLILSTAINPNDYEKLYEALKNNPNIKSVYTNIIKAGNMEYWNDYLRCFVDENGKLCMDPAKFTLGIDCDDISALDDKLLKDIENIEINNELADDLYEVNIKFPNLKNLDILNGLTKINIKNIFDEASNNSFYKLPYLNELYTRKLISKENPSDSFCIADDCSCIINIDKIAEKPLPKDEKISVNHRDIEKIGIENLEGRQINLIINNASELSCELIEEYQKKGLSLQCVKVVGENYDVETIKPYSIEDYKNIRQKLEELVEGIDLNLPEKERFAKVYERVGKYIVYDVPAAYPKNDKEKEYEKEQTTDSRNLKNGLLKGKCVCAGYAEILRNALRMVGIEAVYASGKVKIREINPKDIDKYKKFDLYKTDDGKHYIVEGHAWNKVKLDGKWYNADVTWDSNDIRQGKSPKHCLKTDEEIQRKENKIDFLGLECITEVSDREIDTLFGNKHLYIGNRKIPNMRDMIAFTKEVGLVYVEVGTELVKCAKELKDKVKNMFLKNKTPLLNSKNSENNETPGTSNSWNLENWGIDKKEFENKTRNISNSKNDINNYHTKDNERE